MAAPASAEKQYDYSYHYSYESAFSESGYSEGSKQAPKPASRAQSVSPAVSVSSPAGLAAAAAAPDVEMDNLEDTWLTEDVPKGTVIASAKGDADLEDWPTLSTAGEPNCVVKVKGRSKKLVAIRDIQEGESLIVAEGSA